MTQRRPFTATARPPHAARAALAICLFLMPVIVPVMPCSAQEQRHACSVQCTIVASSRIYTSPFSRDPMLRSASTDIGASIAWSVSYAHAITPSTWLQGSFDYLPVDDETIDNFGTPLADGFHLYCAELTGVFQLPVSGKSFLLFIEGGGGVYWGTRRLSVASVSARALSTRASFGIVTAFGAEYRVLPSVSVKAHLRFRDPQVTAENVFDQPSVESGGVEYVLETTPFSSRLNPNGNIYGMGIVVRF
jgi:hypothetical protein